MLISTTPTSLVVSAVLLLASPVADICRMCGVNIALLSAVIRHTLGVDLLPADGPATNRRKASPAQFVAPSAGSTSEVAAVALKRLRVLFPACDIREGCVRTDAASNA